MRKISTQQRSAQKKYPSIVTFGELNHFQYVTRAGCETRDWRIFYKKTINQGTGTGTRSR